MLHCVNSSKTRIVRNMILILLSVEVAIQGLSGFRNRISMLRSVISSGTRGPQEYK
jgi:hypothetical protein